MTLVQLMHLTFASTTSRGRRPKVRCATRVGIGLATLLASAPAWAGAVSTPPVKEVPATQAAPQTAPVKKSAPQHTRPPAPAESAPQAATGPAQEAAPAATPSAPAPATAETDTPVPQPVPTEPVLTPADLEELEAVRSPALNLITAIETLEKTVERNRENDEELASTRLEIEGLIEASDQTFDNLTPRRDALARQGDKLGPPPAKDAPPEAQQVAHERARLDALLAEVNGALKTTDLAKVRARQLYADVQKLRQSIFAGQILRRSPSPLAPSTWQQLGSDISGAGRQIGVVLASWSREAEKKWLELSTLLAAVSVLFLALSAITRRFLALRLPSGRTPPPAFFEQAATAGWVAPVMAFPATAAVALLAAGLSAMGLLTYEIEYIAAAALPACVIFISVSALARAVLEPSRPDWRLVDLADQPTRKLTRILTRLAGIYAADIVCQEAIRRLFLPLSISVLETAAASIAIALLLFQLVRTPFDPRQGSLEPSHEGEPQGYEARSRPLSHPRLVKLPLLFIAIAIMGLSLAGYIGLGRFIAGQVILTGSAIALALLLHLAIRALVSGSGSDPRPFGGFLEERMGLTGPQSGTIANGVAAVLNTALVLLAVPLVLLTWGYSPREALAWLEAAIFGFEIGEFKISLARILLAVLLFLGLTLATRIAQRWLDTSVLKSKSLDQGIANSIRTGVGYAGFILAVLVAVSYGGLDITNFAIVAGALSVGIGFGLQSIVNNFVSGLILLVERPIKVGDWVVVKGQEGYVRRIAVRSTEIETFDRASLFVPNSDLITSTVTNWTHRNALGRIVIRVGVAYNSDPELVRTILDRAGKECSYVLQTPPPFVNFDNFGASALEFSLRATIPDINKTLAAQTDLRMRILKEFRQAGIEMPYAQHDIHLRDLDVVRQLITRAAEERTSRPQPAQEPKAPTGSTNPPPTRFQRGS